MTEPVEGVDEEVSPVDAPDGSPDATGDLSALISAYADLRVRREASADHTKELKAAEDAAAVALFDAMERLSLRSVRHARGLFSLNDLAWPKLEDSEAAREWAKVAAPELLTLNLQRMQTRVREYVRGEADELPPGVGYSISRGINWRRS